jgi:preprotein translocase subunit SecY
MKKFIETLRNIWSIPELRKRILFTLFILAVYRLGAHVVLPGVVPSVLDAAVGQRSGTDILGLINIFSGGAFNNASIFALGIMPYITASIIIQLLGFVVPYFQKLQQQEGESGRKKINQYTRFLTLLITLVQGAAYIGYIQSLQAVDPDVSQSLFWVSSIIILATGTLFAMWLGEKITDRGIGNGISLLIMVGIIASLPIAFASEFVLRATDNAWFTLILEIAGLFIVTMLTLMAVQGIRRIPIQFAKRMIGRTSANMPQTGARDYIPLKVNAAGVMPIIFAQAIMFLPVTLSSKLGGGNNAFIASLGDWKSVPYNIIFFLLVVLFTYVYTALLVNPQQYAEYLKRQNAFIPGIKPGKSTEDYIDTLTTRVTLPGSIFLGFISILPAIVGRMGVNDAFAIFFGGTSLLIMVGVALDTLQQIESYLLRRKYDGLVKSGKIKGRSSGMQSIGAGI